MFKPRPISGFPEWLPAQRLYELEVLDTIRRVYELYGYASLETPAAELVEVLEAKGVEGKELYALERLHGEPGARRELA
ncbi:MAG: histidine--tRNA ligase, partial [Candidatus Eremiobacterota bacterium]